MQALPIIKIFKEVPIRIFTNYKSFLRLTSPFIIYSIFSYLGFNTLLPVVDFLLSIVFAVLAIVGCHRVFLLDKEEVMQTRIIRWGRSEASFIGWWILIGLCGVLIVYPLMYLFTNAHSSIIQYTSLGKDAPLVAMIPVLVIICYIFLRCSLVFPAASIEEETSFSWSWSISKGNSLRLAFLIGLIPMLSSAIFESLPEIETILYSALIELLWSIIVLFEIGLLSLSYQWLNNNQERITEYHHDTV